jgi:hypothetical protein
MPVERPGDVLTSETVHPESPLPAGQFDAINIDQDNQSQEVSNLGRVAG